MKVFWDALLYEPESAGIGRYIQELVAAYRVAFPDDELTALVMEGRRLAGVRQIIPNLPVQGSRQRLWFEQVHLGAWARRETYDVMHFGDYQMPILRPLPRTVVTVHDLVAFKFPQLFPKNMGRVKRFLMRHSVSRATHVIVPSRTTAEDLHSILGVRPEKITVVPHGVSPISGESHRERMHPRPYFLAVGTLEPRKNFERLIEAFGKRFADDSDGPDLLIAGKPGWLYGSTMSAPDRYGIANRVHFFGFVPDPDLGILYRDAIAVVYPSLYEGFGFPAAEALIRAKPLLCSAGGALQDLAGDAALLVDPYGVDAIAEGLDAMWRDIQPWQQRAAQGALRVREMTWHKAAIKTRRVYEKVAGKELS
jgi:glycosyltransferase involved in cell wall biosynthesis